MAKAHPMIKAIRSDSHQTEELPCRPAKKAWIVGLRVPRGGISEDRQYNVSGADEAEAVKAARSIEPVSTVRFVREG